MQEQRNELFLDLIVIWSSVLLKETNKVMIENERNDVTEGIVEAFVTINQVRTLVNVECPIRGFVVRVNVKYWDGPVKTQTI